MALVGGKKSIKGALAIGLAAVLLVLPMAVSAGATDPTAEASCDPLSSPSSEPGLEGSLCLLEDPTVQPTLSPSEGLPAEDPAPSQSSGSGVTTMSEQTGSSGQETPPVDSASEPPWLEAKLDRDSPNYSGYYRPRPGPRTTVELMEILTSLRMSRQEMGEIVAPFPVLGPASYSDDWGHPRYDPYFHLHEGIDVFASRGTPLIASSDGVVTRMATDYGAGGTSLRLTATGGTYYYYAHLDHFAPGLREGQRVKAGEILGFVGNTGNAESGAPHLHFEIHPYGGAAVPPLPYLDQWLAEALATARSLQGAEPKNVFSAIGDRVLEFVYGAEATPTKILNQMDTSPVHAWGWAGTLAMAIALWMWGWRRQSSSIGLGELIE